MAKKSALKKIATAATRNSNEITLIIETVGFVVAAASELLEAAQPMMENVDTAALAAKARSGIAVADEGAGKAVGDAVVGAAETAASILARLGDVKDGLFEDLAKARGEKEL